MGHFTLTIIDVPTLLGLFVFFLRHRHPQKALFHDPIPDAQCMGKKFTIGKTIFLLIEYLGRKVTHILTNQNQSHVGQFFPV